MSGCSARTIESICLKVPILDIGMEEVRITICDGGLKTAVKKTVRGRERLRRSLVTVSHIAADNTAKQTFPKVQTSMQNPAVPVNFHRRLIGVKFRRREICKMA